MKSRTLSDGSFILVFKDGDRVVEGLTSFAVGDSVDGVFFFGLGAFESATIAFFDRVKMEYEHIPIREQVEVMSIIGNITLYGGQPKIHAHVVLGKRDGSAHGGHLIEAVVRPTLEIFAGFGNWGLRRVMDQATGLPLIDLGE